MPNKRLELRKPDDMHLHLRQGANLPLYARDSLSCFKKVLVMPNTVPPIDSVESLESYRREILEAAPGLQPLMTFMLKPSMSASLVEDLAQAGAVGGKLYPAGVTTNSQDGVFHPKSIHHLLEVMQDKNLVLNIHGEDPESFCLDREKNFLHHIQELSSLFPRLRIVLEHISDKASVEFIRNCSGPLAATITVHHLLLTLDDVIGGHLQPHHFCKPVAKTPQDREAILQAALGGNPRFFLGTDSAPHPQSAKECSMGCAGIYTAPVAVPLLINLFQQADQLPRLEDFTSRFGSEFYQLPLNQEQVSFIQQPWRVPETMHEVIPFYAGKRLEWKQRI